MTSARNPATKLLIMAAASVAVVQVLLLLGWYWPGVLPDTNTSGVWIALADDAARGNFYRPLISELGTGGTRYMPLFFSMHGALIAIGLSPVASGVGLTLTSAGLLVWATSCVLRELGIPRLTAWLAALLLLGTVSFQLMLLTVRGDFLAAALNLFGVAVVLRSQADIKPGALALAAVLFAAAFLTKLTTVFGLLAMVAWLMGRRGVRGAVRLLGLSLVLMIVGVAIANGLSAGRMLASFLAVAPGGMTRHDILEGPMRFATECAHDPLSIVLFVSALACSVVSPKDPNKALVTWLGGATFAATLFIFLSPGTAANHLIDLQAAALITIAWAASQTGLPMTTSRVGVAALLLGMVATWFPGVPSIRRFFDRHGRPKIASVEEFLARGGAGVKPMLAENPLIPIVAGERPVVLDWFNLRLLLPRHAGGRERIVGGLRRGEFGSVVLSNWPGVFPRDVASPDDPLVNACWPALMEREDLPPVIAEALRANYRVVLVRRPYIYLLKMDRPFAASR